MSNKHRYDRRGKNRRGEDKSDNTVLIIGSFLIFIVIAIVSILLLESSNKPVTKKPIVSDDVTADTTPEKKLSTNYETKLEDDITTNSPFIEVRNKLKGLYDGTSEVKITDADKTIMFKQIDATVEIPGVTRASSVLIGDVYDKSIYNLMASLDINNTTINSSSAVNQISNQLDLLNSKENIDFIYLDRIKFDRCSKEIEPQIDLTGKEVCKVDKLPAIENFELYNSLTTAFRKNSSFTSGEKNSAIVLIHNAIRYAGYNIDLQDKMKVCTNLQIFNMLISNSIEDIINLIPTEYIKTTNARFIGDANNQSALFNKKCVVNYNDWTDAKTTGVSVPKVFTPPGNNELKKCKLNPVDDVYSSDISYNKLLFFFEYKGDWTDNQRNTAIVLVGKYYNKLKLGTSSYPDLGLQGRSNKELYNMLLANNPIDLFNASNIYYMAGGMEGIDWMKTSDSYGCSKNWKYIKTDGTLVSAADNYILNDWCKMSKN